MSNNISQQTIPYGNDFDISVTVTRFEDGEYVPLNLSLCSNLHMVIISNVETQLEYTIDASDSSVILAHVDYDLVESNVRYGIAVYGVDEDGNNFRWQMNPNEGFLVVSNTSAMNVCQDTILVDVAGRVGWSSPGISSAEVESMIADVYDAIEEETDDREDEDTDIRSHAFGSISREASQVNFISISGGESVALNTATTSAAGVMSASQVASLASKAEASDVPNAVTTTSTEVKVQHNTTDLFTIPTATSSTAGVMNASQAQLLINAAPNSSVPNTYVQASNINGIKFQHDEDGTVTDLFNLYPATTVTAGVMSPDHVTSLASKAEASDVPNAVSTTNAEVEVKHNANVLFSIPTATSSTAGVMSAAQVNDLADKADEDDVPNAVTATSTEVKLQHNDTDLFSIPTATSSTAGVMSAEQVSTLGSIGTTVSEHTTTLGQVIAKNTEQDTAISNALATALGAGSETAFNSTIKREELTSEQLNSRLNSLITDRRGNETNGMYVFHHSYGHTAILIMGGNCQSDTPTSSQFRMQYIIGNITISSDSDTSLGFTNGCTWSTLAIDVLARQIHYTGNGTDYEVTSQWASWYNYNSLTSNASAADLSDIAMRPFYIEGNGISNAVVYNSTTGYYELNGLTNITPEQMRTIYNYTHVIPCASACSPAPIRTNLPWHVYKVQYSSVGTADLDLSKMFRSCSRLEVCVLTTSSYYASPANSSHMFNGCSYLRSVSDISLERINDSSKFTAMFKGCSRLESILIRKLHISGFSLSDSPNITAASISYLIENANNSAAIEVTVNATTLANITNGEGDWAGIAAAAAEKNITFVS